MPYEFQSIIDISEKNIIRIESEDDIWDYIMQLYKESQEADSKYPLLDIKDQIPFFCCPNHILDSDCQKDISKYIYCKEVGIPPHDGEYGIQPNLWVDKFWSIKNAMNIREYKQSQELRKKHGSR